MQFLVCVFVWDIPPRYSDLLSLYFYTESHKHWPLPLGWTWTVPQGVPWTQQLLGWDRSPDLGENVLRSWLLHSGHRTAAPGMDNRPHQQTDWQSECGAKITNHQLLLQRKSHMLWAGQARCSSVVGWNVQHWIQEMIFWGSFQKHALWLTSISSSSFHCGCEMPILSSMRENLNLFSAMSIDSGDVPRMRAYRKKCQWFTKFQTINSFNIYKDLPW